MNLWSLLESRAQRTPDRQAFAFMAETGYDIVDQLTWGQLYRRAEALSGRVAAQTGRGGRALLLHPPGLEFVVALFACIRAGVLAIPTQPPEPARLPRTVSRIRAVTRDASPSLLLTSETLAVVRSGLFRDAPELLSLPCLSEARRRKAPRPDRLGLRRWRTCSTPPDRRETRRE